MASKNEYAVYETREVGENYIGSVQASNISNAIDKAHDKYGAPINVVAE